MCEQLAQGRYVKVEWPGVNDKSVALTIISLHYDAMMVLNRGKWCQLVHHAVNTCCDFEC